MSIYHEILQKYWGYNSFRPLQEDIIQSVSERKDTLGLLPTGGGKSLTFQVPTMAMVGICLVITPLIALMKDQVDNLKQRGIKALSVYTGMSRQEIIVTLENAILGDYKFLYVSPERLESDLFMTKLKSMNICLLVVDEAHCISQWGYDFRPSYVNIANIRQYLVDVPILALTATATPEVVDDIQEKLLFKNKNVFQKSFERTNLTYSVYETENKMGALIKILDKIKGCSIIYVRSRQRTKDIATELVKLGYSADYYHAGLSSEEKTRKQNAWKSDECRIIVSTNAFGMGIDKPDVRLVVHTDLPNSVEEYFQEAGRGGRDEKDSNAIILYIKSDGTKLKKRIADEFPEREFILRVYDALAYFLQVAEGSGIDMMFDFNLYQFCSTYKLPVLPTHNALKILDLSGYIEYTDEVENRSRIIFKTYRDELYQYTFDSDNEQLINVILRLYTGLFTDYVSIDETTIAIRLGKTRNEVYEMLKSLSKRNIIDYIPHKKTPFIIYKHPRQQSKYIQIPKTVYDDRKIRFKRRIEGISYYAAQKNICRSRVLLAYFGENNSNSCGKCDVCLANNKKRLSTTEFENISIRIKELLKEQALDITSLTELLPDYPSEDVIDTIRFLMDNNTIALDIDKLKLI